VTDGRALLRSFAIVGLCLLTLGSCGGDPEATRAGGSRVTSTPSPSASGLTVTAEALCIEMVPHLQRATDVLQAFLDDPQGFYDRGGSDRLERVLEDLAHDRAIAPAEFRPSLDVQIQLLQAIVDYLEVGGDTHWGLRDFKSAGYDLSVRCDGP
jgi:hypothetical protein